MAIRGVLLDYSGTLFRLEPGAAWVDGLVGHDGAALDQVAQDSLLVSLTAPVGPSAHLPAELQADWERRDLDPDVHRSVYIATLWATGLDIGPGVAETLYERIREPRSWVPSPKMSGEWVAIAPGGAGILLVRRLVRG